MRVCVIWFLLYPHFLLCLIPPTLQYTRATEELSNQIVSQRQEVILSS